MGSTVDQEFKTRLGHRSFAVAGRWSEFVFVESGTYVTSFVVSCGMDNNYARFKHIR